MVSIAKITQELNELLEIKESIRTEYCKRLIEEYKSVINLINKQNGNN